VQDVVGRGTEQQRQPVTAMAANHDQVAALLLGQAMHFLARLAVGQVALFRREARVAVGEAVHALAGLVELLLLQHGEVHRYVAAEGHRHGFDDMYQAEPGTRGTGQGLGAGHDRVALLGQVDRDQNMLVGHGESSLGAGRQWPGLRRRIMRLCCVFAKREQSPGITPSFQAGYTPCSGGRQCLVVTIDDGARQWAAIMAAFTAAAQFRLIKPSKRAVIEIPPC